MSIWTHVVGNIRVDGIPGLIPESSVDHLIKLLGPMSTFDEPNDACTLPCGSEGSIHYQIIEYNGGMPWATIPIWGDLRSYEDLKEIETWFQGILQKLGSSVRDAVLMAECEYGGSRIVLTSKKEVARE